MRAIKSTIAVILSLPLLLMWAAFDIIKFPIILLFVIINGLFELIDWLRLGHSFWSGTRSSLRFFLSGTGAWLNMLHFHVPVWMGGDDD
jgi:hypothetical protein